MALPTVTFEIGLHAQTDGTGHRMVYLGTLDDRHMIVIARTDPWPGAFNHGHNVLVKPNMPAFENAQAAADWLDKYL
jgi:hypothetical protein